MSDDVAKKWKLSNGFGHIQKKNPTCQDTLKKYLSRRRNNEQAKLLVRGGDVLCFPYYDPRRSNKNADAAMILQWVALSTMFSGGRPLEKQRARQKCDVSSGKMKMRHRCMVLYGKYGMVQYHTLADTDKT
jgi:hypothetical protein